MGGDLGPRITLPATHCLAKQYPEIVFSLFGDHRAIQGYFGASTPDNIIIVDAPATIAMDESPAAALRHKRNSSMGLALKSVADGEAVACVSAGNTGALVALGCHYIGTVDGVDRPAIGKQIPTANGNTTYMLDLGANVGCSSEQLIQFARLGAGLLHSQSASALPSVSLLNIGVESNKGIEVIRTAASELKQYQRFDYAGFIEGDSIYNGDTNVIVCDGFIGNIALKTSEGLARFLKHSIKTHYQQSLYGRCLGFLSKTLWREWSEKMDPGRYNGASLLGLNAVVVKSHGGVGATEFSQAIRTAITLAKQQSRSTLAERFAYYSR